MKKLDMDFVRSQFPAFTEPSMEGWAFFESAGGSYPCRQFIDRLSGFYMKNKVQVNYPYPASMKAGELMEASYKRMADYLNVDELDIHFGPSTTQNVYVLANAMRPLWEDGDEIIVSCQDHEANSGAWRRLADRGMKIREWHVDPETGLLDPADLEELFSSRTKMVAFPHCSNVIGHINPAKNISRMIHDHGALSVVDGVGYAPHGFPNLKDLDADIYLFLALQNLRSASWLNVCQTSPGGKHGKSVPFFQRRLCKKHADAGRSRSRANRVSRRDPGLFRYSLSISYGRGEKVLREKCVRRGAVQRT
ncbi:MAG: aminotransferase class V-fold PLP-dependent enzyme [Candidatus Marinimicrobia bacterium]|nr:aminotransferase class V-fold PLP-dependent enzyme [Candidatus Neomarinimicrobiota bacterium]